MYGVDGKQITRWRTFLFPSITGENEGHMRYDRYQFTPQCLLAELYLYKRDYHNAAINAMTEITLGGRTGGGECYIMPLRGAYSSGWKNCIHTYFRWEDITMASYNPRMYETNRLEDFASNVSPYSYYVRPTQVAMAVSIRQVYHVSKMQFYPTVTAVEEERLPKRKPDRSFFGNGSAV